MEFAKIYFYGKVAENNIATEEPNMNRINDASIDDNKDLSHVPPIQQNFDDKKDKSLKFISDLAESFPITLKDKKKAVLSFSGLPIKKADIELLKKYIDLMAENWANDEDENGDK